MRNTLWVLLVCGLLAAACATVETVTPDGSKAFVGATLFDGTGSDPISNAVIVVRDGRIVAAGTADAVEIPAGAERVDIAGKTAGFSVLAKKQDAAEPVPKQGCFPEDRDEVSGQG